MAHTTGSRTRIVVVIAAVAASVSACQGGAGAPSWDRQAVTAYLEQAPGVPLVLPKTLPPGYGFLGPGFEQRAGGLVAVRTSDFRLDDPTTSEVVEICVAAPGSPTSACVPPDALGRAVVRRSGAYPVWIRPLGTDAFSAADLTFWRQVPLTDDPDSVAWLR